MRTLFAWGIASLSLALLGAPVAGASTKHKHRSRVHHPRKPVHRVTRPATHPTAAPASQKCANADTSAASASPDVMRAAVVCLINQQRTSRGLPSLTVSSQLNTSAQNWNDVMAATDDFTHGPGNAFADRISAAGYDWQDAGENIATGYPTPSAVVSAWMASPDHCTNILDPSFRNVGTGESPVGLPSQQSGPALWTQDFGLLMSQSPLSSNTGPQKGCPY